MNDSARFPVPILLMECFLAGFCRCVAEKYWDRLAIGEELGLAREANFTVAQMLDRGEFVEARIAAAASDADDQRDTDRGSAIRASGTAGDCAAPRRARASNFGFFVRLIQWITAARHASRHGSGGAAALPCAWRR